MKASRAALAAILLAAPAARAFITETPQEQMSFEVLADRTIATAWPGVEGRTYFLQWSVDLVHWHYLPMMRHGAGPHTYQLPVRTPGSGRATVPLPDAGVVQAKLDGTFGLQLNAWISCDYKTQQTYNYDPDGDGYAVASGPELTDMPDAASFAAADADIRVFVIDNVFFRENPEAVGDNMNFEIYGLGRQDKPVIIINAGNPAEGMFPGQAFVDTLAHEIGHVMIGPGHPSDYNIELQFGGLHGGPAPLPGTNVSQRLMSALDGRVPGAKRLVKTEWDKAEAWLSTRPNGDN